MNIVIGDYGLEKDLGLHILAVEFGTAEVKKREVELPGANGALDLTEAATGYPVYDKAQHKISCDFRDGTYQRWLDDARYIKGLLHGRKLAVRLNDEPYTYTARVSVDTSKINPYYSSIDITLDAEPFRISDRTTLEDWLWDSFDFEHDVAQYLGEIAAPATVSVWGDAMPTGCTFYCSEAMTLEFEGVTYQLPQGKSSSDDIIIKRGENQMTFAGGGTVGIEYRWGRF